MQKALDYYNQALLLLRVDGASNSKAETLQHIATTHSSLGENQKALDYLNQALPFFRAAGDRSSEVNTLVNIAKYESNRGNLIEARARIEEALTIVESLRTKIAGQELRSSYFRLSKTFMNFTLTS